MKIKLIIFFTILFSLSASAQNNKNEFVFSFLTTEEGLPNNYVDEIFKDSKGFIWIATSGCGLIRFDGYDFLQFSTSSSHCQIKNNYVTDIAEDDFHRLWIISEGGLDVIDLNTYHLVDLESQCDISKSLYSSATHLFKDSQGNIWINSEFSLFCLELDKNGTVVKYRTLKYDDNNRENVSVIYEADQMLLMGMGNTVYSLTLDNQTSIVPRKISSNLTFNCSSINSMFAKDNQLWIGTDKGLFRYDFKTSMLKTYMHDANNPRSISQNMITDICIGFNNNIYIATLFGLNVYNNMTDDFESFCQYSDLEKQRTINNNFLNCLFFDNNSLWIGTESGGVNRMSIQQLSLKNYSNQKNNPNSLSNGPVNSVYVDNNGVIYVGCTEGGLNIINKTNNTIKHLTQKDGLIHNSVSVIKPVGENLLWLGTWGGGISIFNPKENKFIDHIDNQNSQYDITFVGSLDYDRINNGVWIGTNRGIFFYDLQSKTISNPLPQNYSRGIFGCLGSMIDRSGTLWIGVSNGILNIDLKSFSKDHQNFNCKKIEPNSSDRKTAFFSKATCFLQSSDGTIYIGTNGYGVVYFRDIDDIQNYNFLNSANGLCNDVVSQIMEDDNHSIWVGTTNGIACKYKESGRLINYGLGDGLCSNHFFWNGFCKSQYDSHLFFGSICGLVEIDPNQIISQTSNNNPVFTFLRVSQNIIFANQTSGILDKDISQTDKIILHERDKSFSLEFSALNYEIPKSVQYRYRLIGFDNDWIYVNNTQRFASYAALRPGKYELQVSCAAGKKSFDDSITKLTIIVKPYFYKTWWFATILIILIAIIVWQIILLRFKNLSRQKHMLQEMVETRTLQLENRTKELAMQNNILSQQNEKITQQKQQLETMANKVKELTVDKLAFFTNITHEFRTPVTLIIGPIERALKLSTNPKVIEQLNFVHKNSQHLLTLINQLMDFRKVENQKLEITISKGNIVCFGEDMVLPFRAFAEEKNINLKTYFRFPEPFVMFDREALTKIITNLLGNAMKFTPKEGTVSIYMGQITNPNRLYLCVSDTGQGIKEEDIDKIFNRFYQSKNTDNNQPLQSGTGIGLYLCKRLSELLGGTIQVKNNKTAGASFRIIIPLELPEKEIERHEIIKTIDAIEAQNEKSEDSQNVILVVEDNSDMSQYIKSILEDDYFVLTASSGKDALEVLKQNMVDFIITDLMMPEMDGNQLARIVKRDFATSHIPILMLTAKTSKETQLESFKSGVDDYILKPFDEAMLKARIESLIENRKRYQQRFNSNFNIEDLHVSQESGDKKFVDKAIKIIKENYKNSYYEVSDFVQAMGVSKSLLNKKMQTLIGQSAGQFLRNYRLNLAREIILNNRFTRNMNISEIAYEVGFNDPKYFTRCFTKHFGVTPSQMLSGQNGKVEIDEKIEEE